MKKLFSLLLIGFLQSVCAQITDEPVAPPMESPQDNSQVYSMANIEGKPDFPGGLAKFYEFFEKNYVKPKGTENLKGKVFVTFVVDTDGSLTDIKVLRDFGSGTGEEAVRVLKSCLKWIPGQQNGKKVRVQYSLPLRIGMTELKPASATPIKDKN